jgi:hypothetical protein
LGGDLNLNYLYKTTIGMLGVLIQCMIILLPAIGNPVGAFPQITEQARDLDIATKS